MYLLLANGIPLSVYSRICLPRPPQRHGTSSLAPQPLSRPRSPAARASRPVCRPASSRTQCPKASPTGQPRAFLYSSTNRPFSWKHTLPTTHNSPIKKLTARSPERRDAASPLSARSPRSRMSGERLSFLFLLSTSRLRPWPALPPRRAALRPGLHPRNSSRRGWPASPR
jgi:hypothetical protein